jgi:pyridinium-3,5-biscarboxylic acid mononucleotide sulfurtransferase
MSNSIAIEQLAARLEEHLHQLGQVVVAFSGGVDSAVVAKGAALASPASLAVTAVSPSLPQGEAEEAAQLAKLIGIEHLLLKTDEFSRNEYTSNPSNRCYYCKQTLYTRLAGLPAPYCDWPVVNGANADDLGDYRPGMLAAKEFGVLSPLAALHITKPQVRELARYWGLPCWNKPAGPCLSSRIAYGIAVTPERVTRIDKAERYLKDLLNIDTLRVRCEANELARIEVPQHCIPMLCERGHFAEIALHLQGLGFKYVTLDLAGFRSGSMNAVLPILN